MRSPHLFDGRYSSEKSVGVVISIALISAGSRRTNGSSLCKCLAEQMLKMPVTLRREDSSFISSNGTWLVVAGSGPLSKGRCSAQIRSVSLMEVYVRRDDQNNQRLSVVCPRVFSGS